MRVTPTYKEGAHCVSDGRVRWRARIDRSVPTYSLSMSRFGRQHPRVDADAVDRFFPFRLIVDVEDDGVVGRRVQPGIGLDLGIELAGAPAGITQRQQD